MTISLYDDETSILMRYALQHNELPSYFTLRILGSDTILKNGSKCEILFIKDEIKNINLSDFSERGILTKLSILFPDLTQEDFVYSWIQVNGMPEDIAPFRKLNRYLFSTKEAVEKRYKEYLEQRDEKLENARKNLERRDKLIQRLTSINQEAEGIEVGNFSTSSTILSLALVLPEGDGLYEVFDKIVVGPNMPYAVLVMGNRIYTKVYTNITPPLIWLERQKDQDGIYFYILHSADEGITSKIVRLIEGAGSYYDEDYKITNRHFSKGVWTPENRVEIELTVNKDISRDVVIGRFKDSFENLSFEIVAQNYTRLKGNGLIQGLNLYTVPFADMVTNDGLFREFLFFNEISSTVFGKLKHHDDNKQNLNRERPTVLFSWLPMDDKNYSSSVILNLDSTIKSQINVKLIRVRTETQGRMILEILRTLLGKYEKERVKIYLDYTLLLGRRELPEIEFKEKKPGKNIGPRTILLQNQRPDLFVQGYPSSCGKEKQPKLLNKEQAEEMEEVFVKKYGSTKGKHKIMNYPLGSDDFYVCDPRDEDDKNSKHTWPGLRENNLILNQTTEPYLPCCYAVDHYKKKGSLLNKYISGETSEKSSKEKKVENKNYVPGADKSVELGRFGKVPHYLKQFANISNYNLIRIPVDHSPDSFLKCILSALDKYDPLENSSLSSERKRISVLPLAPLKQSLYDYKDQDIIDLLLSDGSYLDPDVFLPFFEQVYDVNIFLFEVTKKYPGGQMLVPRHHPYTKYLSVQNKKRNTIMVIKYDSQPPKQQDVQTMLKREEYPFQCELIGAKSDKYLQKIFEPKDTLSTLCMESFHILNNTTQVFDLNQTYQLTVDSYKNLYKLLDDSVKSQTLDLYGKTRILWLQLDSKNLLPIFTPPLPPLFISERDDTSIKRWSRKIALKFIDENKLKILGQDGIQEEMKIQGLWVGHKNICPFYIPLIVPSDEIVKVRYTKKIDPISVIEDTDLENFRHLKKLAEFLLQYLYYSFSNFLYSLKMDTNQLIDYQEESIETFFTTKTIIIPNYEYPKDILSAENKILSFHTPFFDSEGRLILSNDVISRKLRTMLKTALLNDRNYIYSFMDKTIVELSYSRVTDFIEHPNQILFLTTGPLREWRDRRKYGVDTVGDILSRDIQSVVMDIDYKDPYFFKHPALENKLCILQNVLGGSIERSATVSNKWMTKKFNLGYYSKISNKDVPVKIYHIGKGTDGEGVPVLKSGTKFIAILFIE